MTATMDVVESSKSPSDKKQYRLLTLPNALQALLISTVDVTGAGADDEDARMEMDDEESDVEDDDDDMSSDDGNEQNAFDGDDDEHGPARRRAGACLTVGVGSFAEPENLPGLAHYLEHMLFMGSEKYPDENEFESFLSAHGGFSNGQTDNEITSYTFEVGPAHLEKALDMFAQFFISPLMKADALDRELSAIDSEFSQATQNDLVRLQQVLCDTSPPTHPYHRFGWGNRLSLKEDPEREGVDVRGEILKFYEHFYSANLMKLVVCGEDSLDDLEKWVRASFSPIANKNVARPEFAASGFPFGQGVDESPLLCRVVPVRDIHILHLSWMIPPIFGNHRQKPAEYIASLIGDESEGSLLPHLKRQGWISSVTAGVTDTDGFDAGTFGARFDVTMKLTLEGIDQWDKIVESVFEYLVMLRASGCPQWVYDELQALADISFRFQEDNSAVELCEQLAQFMQDMFQVPPEDLLKYDLFIGDFQQDHVLALLKYLVPSTVRVCLVSQTHGEKIESFHKDVLEEKWFGVKYSKEVIPAETIMRWTNVSHVHQDIKLPRQNPFIPRDFSLVDESDFVGDVADHPHAFGKMWFKPDRVFQTPRATLAFLIQLPSVTKSAETIVLTELYVKLVRDALNEYAYHASVAELMYSLRVKESGLELLFGGFNDKLGLLVQIVTEKLFQPHFDPQRFELIKQDMVRDYKNALIKTSHKAKYLRLQLLERQSFRIEESLAAAEGATLERLASFVARELWQTSVYLATFVHGNVSRSTAVELQKVLEDGISALSSTAMNSDDQWPERHIHQLPVLESGLLLQANSDHADDKNTHVEYYFQFGEHDVRLLAYADLLHQLMEEPLFDTLRTKQELGYDVSCTVRLTHGVIGFGVMVQSSLFTSAYIRSCIDRFLVEFEHAIKSMPQEHFQDHIKAQILKKLEPDHNLTEMTQRYWYEVTSGRLMFDINEQLASELEHCTKAELLSYYREWIIKAPKKLVVQVIGQASVDVTGEAKHKAAQPRRKSGRKVKETAAEPTVVTDLYALKTELPYYPDRFKLSREIASALTSL